MQMGKQVMSIGDSIMTPFIKLKFPFFYSELNVRMLKMKVANKQALKQVVFPWKKLRKSQNNEYDNKDNELKASKLTIDG